MLPVPPPLPPQSWSPLTESLSQGPVFALPFSVLWLWPCGSVVVQFCAYTPAVLEPPRYTQQPPSCPPKSPRIEPLTDDSWQSSVCPLYSYPGQALPVGHVLAMDTEERAEG